MSNNAAVTQDGGEIGRAQALQARACRVPPCVDMNPVLLKPQSEIGAQVVVQGRILRNAKAREFQTMKPRLLREVLESFGRLKSKADLVLIEGAGSASEINLREGDIANMGFAARRRRARRAHRRHRPRRRDRADRRDQGRARRGRRREDRGFIVNRFRGDPSLFAEGMRADRAAYGLAGAWPRALFREARIASGRGCAGARSAPATRKRAQSPSPCSSCRASPISTISTR